MLAVFSLRFSGFPSINSLASSWYVVRCDSLQCGPGAREGSVFPWNVCFQVDPGAADFVLFVLLHPCSNSLLGPFCQLLDSYFLSISYQAEVTSESC